MCICALYMYIHILKYVCYGYKYIYTLRAIFLSIKIIFLDIYDYIFYCLFDCLSMWANILYMCGIYAMYIYIYTCVFTWEEIDKRKRKSSMCQKVEAMFSLPSLLPAPARPNQTWPYQAHCVSSPSLLSSPSQPTAAAAQPVGHRLCHHRRVRGREWFPNCPMGSLKHLEARACANFARAQANHKMCTWVHPLAIWKLNQIHEYALEISYGSKEERIQEVYMSFFPKDRSPNVFGSSEPSLDRYRCLSFKSNSI